MIRNFTRVLLFAMIAVMLGATQVAAQVGTPIFSNIPNPLPPNVPSVGFQATSTAEWGDDVFFGGTNRIAGSAIVTMSDWAKHSDYPTMPAAGFTHQITLNIYAVDHSGPNPALGALLGTVTQNFLIPWRPEANPLCTNGRWLASDNNCYSGLAFKIVFDLRGLALSLPNEIIYGVAFNTNTWGYQPIGQPGPYESLNVGCANVNGLGVVPSVGTDVEPDATFWNTKFGPFYSDGGAGGVGTFRRDTGWIDFAPAVEFTALTVATTRDGCKNGGWQSLTRSDFSIFKNQGDCIQYLNTGK
jgi:hypothetical protein